MARSTRTTKRTVSNKKIDPVMPAVELEEAPAIENSDKETPEVELEPVYVEPKAPKIPTIIIKTNVDFKNFAIGDGIDWLAGSVHEVDFSTYTRLMRDDPTAFERV